MPEKFEMGIELPSLIKVLGTSLYSNRDVALRELIQNANDSLVKRQVATEQPSGELWLRIDYTANGTLTIRDNGIGMTKKEIHDYLSTIGRSGTAEFRKILESNDHAAAHKLIGTFGLGLLAAFFIADHLEIRTRSENSESDGYKWTCKGDTYYELEPCDKEDVGTILTLTVNPKHHDLLNDESLEHVIRKYADFIEFPIFFGRGRRQINTRVAPWDNKDEDDIHYMEFLRHRYPDSNDPLSVIPVRPRGDVAVKGVLFIPPSKDPEYDVGSVELYVRRAFVCVSRKGPLPRWAVFICGIIEAPALNIQVSREGVQHDAAFKALSEALEATIIEHLIFVAEHKRRTFAEISALYGGRMKAACIHSVKVYDAFKNKLIFRTEHRTVNLLKYMERAEIDEDGKTHIYYLTEPAYQEQYQLLFAEKDLEVIDASDPRDEAFLKQYARVEANMVVSRIDVGAGYLFREVEDPGWRIMENFYGQLIDEPINARVVEFDPKDIPAVLIRGKSDQKRDELKRYLRAFNSPPEFKSMLKKMIEERGVGRDRVLYLNASNAVVTTLKSLVEFSEPDNVHHLLKLSLEQIYFGALSFAREPLTANISKRIHENRNEIICKVCELVLENAKLRTQMTQKREDGEV